MEYIIKITFKLIMMDIQLDEIIRIVAANMAQLLHIFYLSLMSQRLIDHSSGFQEAMYVYKLINNIKNIKKKIIIFF